MESYLNFYSLAASILCATSGLFLMVGAIFLSIRYAIAQWINLVETIELFKEFLNWKSRKKLEKRFGIDKPDLIA